MDSTNNSGVRVAISTVRFSLTTALLMVLDVGCMNRNSIFQIDLAHIKAYDFQVIAPINYNSALPLRYTEKYAKQKLDLDDFVGVPFATIIKNISDSEINIPDPCASFQGCKSVKYELVYKKQHYIIEDKSEDHLLPAFGGGTYKMKGVMKIAPGETVIFPFIPQPQRWTNFRVLIKARSDKNAVIRALYVYKNKKNKEEIFYSSFVPLTPSTIPTDRSSP